METPRNSTVAPDGSTKWFPLTEMSGRTAAFGFGASLRCPSPLDQMDLAEGSSAAEGPAESVFAATSAAQMTERLNGPMPVLLFPEGTSTDGSSVLRFHSRLIDPATTAGVPITAAAVRYVIQDGTPEEKLCWVGETLFLTHLMTTLSTPGFSARVRFGEPHIYTDRRAASDATHAEVTAMRGYFVGNGWRERYRRVMSTE